MISKKIKEALKLFDNDDVNEVVVDANDVIIKITKKDGATNVKSSLHHFIVHSPMVGVVYLKDSHGKALIRKNEKVAQDAVICIIESLKIQHDVFCEHDGIVEEIYVKDHELVEYHQPLIKIRRC